MHGTITNIHHRSEPLNRLRSPEAPADKVRQNDAESSRKPGEWTSRIGAPQKQRHVRHFHRPEEQPFRAHQRDETTILFGGLTWKHETLIQGFLRGLGYVIEFLPTPDIRAHKIGREFCNNGQCNPTYFTVGNLIRHLQELESAGMSREEIIRRHVFFTAGACGPCRFGMYESEYRSALKLAGFDGFRILIVEQAGGLEQAVADAGLRFDLDFTLGLLHAFNIGDVLNDLASQLRPFELEEGATDTALKKSVDHMAGVLGREYARFGTWRRAKSLRRYAAHILGGRIRREMRACRAYFDSVRYDRLRVKPVVKITGEFWAQTTEGDGNFRMFPFLEREGAEVILEPIATWLQYMLHQTRQELVDRGRAHYHHARGLGNKARAAFHVVLPNLRKRLIISIAERLYRRDYNRFRACFDNIPRALPDQDDFAKLARPYFNTRIEGGEGHLEVAKTLYYTKHKASHMVLSLKPFGCLPSTQSDGVMSAVCAHHPDILFLPIETSGDGEIHAHSRVQMALGEARRRAEAEFNAVLRSTGATEEGLRAMMHADPRTMSPFFRAPADGTHAAVAARFAKILLSRHKRREGTNAE